MSQNKFFCVRDFEEEAGRQMPKKVREFVNAGVMHDVTLKENELCMNRWNIIPRFLRDVSQCDVSTNILGHRVAMPFGVAPTGLLKLVHPNGDIAIAKAAARMESIFNISTTATTTIEDIEEATPSSLKFFQIDVDMDRDTVGSLVMRAEAAGCAALVLTVDIPVTGIRLVNMRNKFNLPPHIRLSNLEDGFNDNNPSKNPSSSDSESSPLGTYVPTSCSSCLQWDDIAWLKGLTKLPLILKGVLCGDDAKQGLQAGASAIWVSNHGGRQLDHSPATLDALADVVQAVKGRCKIYVDGGFRTGTDIFKALAIGADMVFMGRPFLWGLACAGEEGAYRVFSLLKEELENTMKLAGCKSVKDISRDMVVHRDFYSRL